MQAGTHDLGFQILKVLLRVLFGCDRHAVDQHLGHHGHNTQHGRLEEVNIVEEFGDVIAQAQSAAVTQGQQQVAADAEDVMDGKDAEAGLPRIVGAEEVIQQVILREHDALAVSGCSGGKNNQCALRGICCIFKSRNPVFSVDLGSRKMLLALLQADDLLHTLTGIHQILDIAQVFIVEKDNIRFRPLEVLNEALFAELHIQGDGNAAGGCDTHQHCQVLIAALADQGDMELFAQLTALVHGPVGHCTCIHGIGTVTFLIDDAFLFIADKHLVFIVHCRVLDQISQCKGVFFCDHIFSSILSPFFRNTKYPVKKNNLLCSLAASRMMFCGILCQTCLFFRIANQLDIK